MARNGPEFEARIRQNEINNPKFNFLNPNDPYHAYYRHKVSEFKEGKAQEPSAAIPKVMQQQQQATQQQLPQKVQAQVIQETIVPKEPLLSLSSSLIPLHLSLRPGCSEADSSVCGQEWASVSDPADAERAAQLPV